MSVTLQGTGEARGGWAGDGGPDGGGEGGCERVEGEVQQQESRFQVVVTESMCC